ncbi:MAG: histidine triad nucleotide-binding protein [Eubacteriaceae bacterium]|jgi:histidine triad (HIT) family protein|nr:histidine triad nucleotide-binding protein [Eubacteriaceae bacterium]
MDENCIFCKIINKELPSTVLFEDSEALAFKDINPQAPAHVVIVPKKHYSDLFEVAEGDGIVAHLHFIAAKLARDLALSDTGFRLVMNCGEDGGQSVGHLHFHLLGGRSLGWPPG